MRSVRILRPESGLRGQCGQSGVFLSVTLRISIPECSPGWKTVHCATEGNYAGRSQKYCELAARADVFGVRRGAVDD